MSDLIMILYLLIWSNFWFLIWNNECHKCPYLHFNRVESFRSCLRCLLCDSLICLHTAIVYHSGISHIYLSMCDFFMMTVSVLYCLPAAAADQHLYLRLFCIAFCLTNPKKNGSNYAFVFILILTITIAWSLFLLDSIEIIFFIAN